jgi:hypothetical protein
MSILPLVGGRKSFLDSAKSLAVKERDAAVAELRANLRVETYGVADISMSPKPDTLGQLAADAVAAQERVVALTPAAEGMRRGYTPEEGDLLTCLKEIEAGIQVRKQDSGTDLMARATQYLDDMLAAFKE